MKTPAQIKREEDAAIKLQREQEESIRNATQGLLHAKNPFPKAPAPVAPVVRETIHADDDAELQKIIKAYKDRYKKEEWYKKPEKNKDGLTTLYFKDEETATAFAKTQAQAGHKFIMIDEKGKVKGYSDGKNFIENTKDKTLDEIGGELGWQNNRPRMR